MSRPVIARLAGATLLGLAVVAPAPAAAQSLAQRVASAPAGPVQFLFPSRADVCGNGRTWFSSGSNTWYGNFNGSGEAMRAECQRGPVRVVLNRAGSEIVDINVFAGPEAPQEGVPSLGTVGGAEASEYLLSLAQRLEGKAGREAILPAMMAEGRPAGATTTLLAIARDDARPRETRQSAMTWLGRVADDQPSEAGRLVQALAQIARDENEVQPARQQAVNTLGRLERGDGIPELITMSSANDPWLARHALSALSRSGDPRARTALRAAIPRPELSEEARVTAIRSLAQQYATSSDAEFLRAQFRTLQGERSREAIVSSLAEMGGSENAKWLLGVVKDAEAPKNARRRALSGLDRAGIPITQVVALYDQLDDRDLRQATISVLGQSGTRAATDKLLAIAKTDTDYQLRRRAVNELSRSEDPRVKDALKDIVVR